MHRWEDGQLIEYVKNGIVIAFKITPDYPFKAPRVIIPGYQAIPVGIWCPAATMLDIYNDYVMQRNLSMQDAFQIAASSLCKSGFAFIPDEKI